MRLTREQRFLLFNGGRPRLAYPVKEGKPCSVAKGHVCRLSSGLEIEVLEVHRRKRKGGKDYEWVIDYLIRDMRPTLLRSVPPIHTHKSDDQGTVQPPTTADIEAARLASSYTHSSHGSVPSAGDAVPEIDHTLLSMRAKAKWAERTTSESERRSQERSIREQMHRAMDDLGPTAQAVMLAGIKRVIEEAQEQEREAA